MNYIELKEYFMIERYDEKGEKVKIPESDKDAVIDFFVNNPNPTDAEFHGWAESEGMDVHDAEEIAYELASKFARFLRGGMYNEKGRPDVDEKQLEMGVKVEYEHTPDADVAQRIALDHLSEIKDYYTRLDKMEKAAGVNKHEAPDKDEYEDE